MKYQNLVDELNNLLDSAKNECEKRQRERQYLRAQCKGEAKKILKKMKKSKNETKLKKLKKELGMVQEAYSILGSV